MKGDIWSCVEVPGSTELLGTGKSVKVDVRVDEVEVSNIGLMPTGTGGHMLSISAKLRKQLGKEIGESVSVLIHRRIN